MAEPGPTQVIKVDPDGKYLLVYEGVLSNQQAARLRAELNEFISDPDKPFAVIEGVGRVRLERADPSVAEGYLYAGRDIHRDAITSRNEEIDSLRNVLGQIAALVLPHTRGGLGQNYEGLVQEIKERCYQYGFGVGVPEG